MSTHSHDGQGDDYQILEYRYIIRPGFGKIKFLQQDKLKLKFRRIHEFKEWMTEFGLMW